MGFNEIAKTACHEHIHNLIDYRFVALPSSWAVNKNILKICTDIYSLTRKFEQSRQQEHLTQVRKYLLKLSSVLSVILPVTSKAIEDFVNSLGYYLTSSKLSDLGNFRPFLGRGQQYLSFIRMRWGKNICLQYYKDFCKVIIVTKRTWIVTDCYRIFLHPIVIKEWAIGKKPVWTTSSFTPNIKTWWKKPDISSSIRSPE